MRFFYFFAIIAPSLLATPVVLGEDAIGPTCEWQLSKHAPPVHRYDHEIVELYDRGRRGIPGDRVGAIHSNSVRILELARKTGRFGMGPEQIYFHGFQSRRPLPDQKTIVGYERPSMFTIQNIGAMADGLAGVYARDNASQAFLALKLGISPNALRDHEIRGLLSEFESAKTPEDHHALVAELFDAGVLAMERVPEIQSWVRTSRGVSGITVLMKPEFLDAHEIFPGGDDPPDGFDMHSTVGDFYVETRGDGISLSNVEAIIPHGPDATEALEALRQPQNPNRASPFRPHLHEMPQP
jgi:hypothetical protein